MRPSGQPDTVPVWFLWDGATVLIYSKPDQAKLRNIAHNPRVSVVLDNTHGGGDVVRIEGTADVWPSIRWRLRVPEYVAKYADAIKRIGHNRIASPARIRGHPRHADQIPLTYPTGDK